MNSVELSLEEKGVAKSGTDGGFCAWWAERWPSCKKGEAKSGTDGGVGLYLDERLKSLVDAGLSHEERLKLIEEQQLIADKLESIMDSHRRLRRKCADNKSFSMRSFLGISRWTTSKSGSQQANNARFAAGRWIAVVGVIVLVIGLCVAHCEADVAVAQVLSKKHIELGADRYQIFIARLASITLMALGAVWFSLKSLVVAKELFTPPSEMSSAPVASKPEEEKDVSDFLEIATDSLPKPAKDVIKAAGVG